MRTNTGAQTQITNFYLNKKTLHVGILGGSRIVFYVERQKLTNLPNSNNYFNVNSSNSTAKNIQLDFF